MILWLFVSQFFSTAVSRFNSKGNSGKTKPSMNSKQFTNTFEQQSQRATIGLPHPPPIPNNKSFPYNTVKLKPSISIDSSSYSGIRKNKPLASVLPN